MQWGPLPGNAGSRPDGLCPSLAPRPMGRKEREHGKGRHSPLDDPGPPADPARHLWPDDPRQLPRRCRSRPDASSLLVCGCRKQARPMLRPLAGLLSLQCGIAWDADPPSAQDYARKAAHSDDVILCCTNARVPYRDHDEVSSGTFIAAVGGRHPGNERDRTAFSATAGWLSTIWSNASRWTTCGTPEPCTGEPGRAAPKASSRWLERSEQV